MCYGERHGLGGDVFVAVCRGGISWALGGSFWFWKLCSGVTHPQPLSRGEIGMCYGEGRGKGRWVARCSFEKLGVARWYLSNISGCFGV